MYPRRCTYRGIKRALQSRGTVVTEYNMSTELGKNEDVDDSGSDDDSGGGGGGGGGAGDGDFQEVEVGP